MCVVGVPLSSGGGRFFFFSTGFFRCLQPREHQKGIAAAGAAAGARAPAGAAGSVEAADTTGLKRPAAGFQEWLGHENKGARHDFASFRGGSVLRFHIVTH